MRNGLTDGPGQTVTGGEQQRLNANGKPNAKQRQAANAWPNQYRGGKRNGARKQIARRGSAANGATSPSLMPAQPGMPRWTAPTSCARMPGPEPRPQSRPDARPGDARPVRMPVRPERQSSPDPGQTPNPDP